MAVKPEDQIPHPVYDWTEWATPEDVEPWDEERMAEALKRSKSLTAAVWDPTKHPRHPSGSPLGGQFAPITAPGGGYTGGERGEAWQPIHDVFQQARAKELDTYSDSMYQYGAGAKREVMNALADRLKNDPAWDPEYVRRKLGWVPVEEMDETYPRFSTDVDKQTVAQLVQAWSFSSSDSASVSLLVQQAAAEEFGAPFDLHGITHGNPPADQAKWASWVNQADALEETIRNVPRLDPKLDGSLRAYVRAQHAATQEMFAGLGIGKDDTVTLYRGMRFEDTPSPFPDGLHSTQIRMNPLSSWTIAYPTAVHFSGVRELPMTARTARSALVAARVPVGRILSTPMSGLGALKEGEVVVLGGPDDDALVWSHPPDRGVDLPEEEFLRYVQMKGEA